MSEEKKKGSNLEVRKIVRNIFLTATPPGVSIADVITQTRLAGVGQEVTDAKLKSIVYLESSILKKKYVNTSKEKRKFLFAEVEEVEPAVTVAPPVEEVKEAPAEVVPDDVPEVDELATEEVAGNSPIEAKDAVSDVTYHSAKGVPCKLISKKADKIELQSLITGKLVLVPLDFVLIEARDIQEEMRDGKRVKR